MLYTLTALAARIFANPAANVFQKQLTMRGGDPVAINLSTYLLLSLACVVPAMWVDWGAMPAAFWWNCVLVGLFGGVGNTFFVKALQQGELSVLGPINSWKSVMGMAVGVVVLGEIPGLWGLTGMALMMAGSYFVLKVPGERFSWNLLRRNDIRWRLWAMALTATEAVFIKRIILLSSPTVSFIIGCWFGALISLVIALIFVRPRGGSSTDRSCGAGSVLCLFRHGNLIRSLGVAAILGLTQYATNVVFARMDVGYALALFQLSAIVSILLGHRVFHEDSVARKLIGAAIMIAGSVVILLLN
ncbi:MAG: EamA family transporter [Alistipes sp.]|jgi:drug/metabolite transporter (DMT)-like permease|nr:EamA family transporter [Alistipes sp.]